MIRLAPLAGLLLASPVVVDAFRGQRDVDEALLAWLLAMLLSAAGLWLLRQALVVTKQPAAAGEPDQGDATGSGNAAPAAVSARATPDGQPRRRREDR